MNTFFVFFAEPASSHRATANYRAVEMQKSALLAVSGCIFCPSCHLPF
uniref:Uncharacterized protein n=1 Tax=Anguilla anguilla TaxID=7936 RepID=A0A0E9QHP3_ANGAN